MCVVQDAQTKVLSGTIKQGSAKASVLQLNTLTIQGISAITVQRAAHTAKITETASHVMVLNLSYRHRASVLISVNKTIPPIMPNKRNV